MNNLEKVKTLDSNSMAFILMCPDEFDDNFKKECNGNNCTECTEKWLQEEYKYGYEYLKGSDDLSTK